MWYTRPALETFLLERDARRVLAGAAEAVRSRAVAGSFPSPTKTVSLIVYLLTAGLMLGVVFSAAGSAAGAEIISYLDQNGRRLYVNTEDEELRQAAARGGVAGALRLIERRKQAMPGIEQHIESISRRHGVDPELVHAVIAVESAWNPNARSRKGALGLMQLLPSTAARFGVRELFDPRQNVNAGVRYLRFLLDRFNNNLEWALAAYNSGENAVEVVRGVPPYRETRAYLQRLRSLYSKLGPGTTGNGSGLIYPTLDAQGRVVYENE